MKNLQKLFELMSKIPHDKLLHSLYGTMVYMVVSLYDPLVAIATVFIVATTKEILDEIRYNGFSVMDIVATIAIPCGLFLSDII